VNINTFQTAPLHGGSFLKKNEKKERFNDYFSHDYSSSEKNRKIGNFGKTPGCHAPIISLFFTFSIKKHKFSRKIKE